MLMFIAGTLGAFAEAFTRGTGKRRKDHARTRLPVVLDEDLGRLQIFGGVAILTGKLPRMKEWAYAGLSIEFLGATAAHLITGDRIYAPFSFSFFIVLIVAYFLWHETVPTLVPFQQGNVRA